MAEERWYAIDEKANDNFATSIYEAGDKGVLVARCNQNGSYPWQGPAIIRGLEANKRLLETNALAAARAAGRAEVEANLDAVHLAGFREGRAQGLEEAVRWHEAAAAGLRRVGENFYSIVAQFHDRYAAAIRAKIEEKS